jgi:hypothetical protein
MKMALSTGKIEKNSTAALPMRVAGGVENRQAERCSNTDPALNINAKRSSAMSLIPVKPGVRPAQAPEDPLIAQARLINEAAYLDQRLAARRALRSNRSEAARLGWGTRRAR